MPASTVTVRSPGSCSTMRFRRVSPSTRPAHGAGMPTPTAVPPPHGTTARRPPRRAATTARTSSTVPGKTAASGVRPSTTYGEQLDAGAHVIGADDRGGACRAKRGAARATSSPRARSAERGPSLRSDAGDTRRRRPRRTTFGREDLAGIAEAGRIEGALQLSHQRQIRCREDERHEVGFLEPDAVLAGDRAADLRADLHDLGAGLHHTLLLARLARIVEDVRMQVAVAGVEHVADAQAVRGDDLVHAREHVRQLRARDDAVHHHVRGRHAAVGAERRLASLPEQLALGLVARRPHLARAARRGRRRRCARPARPCRR